MAQSVSIWTRRHDLIFEGWVLLDASGNYGPTAGALNALPGPDGSAVSPPGTNTWWYSSEGISSLRIATDYNLLSAALSSFTLQESSILDGSTNVVPFRTQSIPVTYPGNSYIELDLTARFFQFQVVGSSSNANGAFGLTVRAMPS